MIAPRQPLHCSWPLKFFETRPNFDRKAENQTYIQWLRDVFKDVDDASGVEYDQDEDEDEGDEKEEEDDEDGGASVCYLDIMPHN